MSRVGKKPILIPQGVQVQIEGKKIMVKGPKGELKRELRPEIKVEVKDNQVRVLPEIESKQTKALWGLSGALVANMIKGVLDGYEKKLEIEGLGFKAQLEGSSLFLSVGFSHPIKIEAPEGIKFSVEKNIITVSGADKELVGQTAAAIRKVKRPEPYKGKGIKYFGEQIRRKVGKKVVATK
jgi:large subunit ribosomal protein L6